jgi:hypothetical protein
MDYRLYFVRGGRIRDVVDIHAANDSAALGEAEEKAAGAAAELWCQSRLVCTLPSVSAA